MGVGGGRVARVNTPPDLDAEQEVDLRSVWERIAARWWMPVLGVLLGLLIGFALALGGGKVYQAETLVAMGQPFSPNGGAPAGALYNVGGGAEATMRDAIAALERVSGRTLDVVEKPAAAGDVRRTAADTRKIEGDLGWHATTALEDGLRAQWQWASVRVAAP